MTIAGVDEAKTRLRVQATGDTAGTRTSKDIPTPSRSAPLDFGCSRPENRSCARPIIRKMEASRKRSCRRWPGVPVRVKTHRAIPTSRLLLPQSSLPRNTKPDAHAKLPVPCLEAPAFLARRSNRSPGSFVPKAPLSPRAAAATVLSAPRR